MLTLCFFVNAKTMWYNNTDLHQGCAEMDLKYQVVTFGCQMNGTIRSLAGMMESLDTPIPMT